MKVVYEQHTDLTLMCTVILLDTCKKWIFIFSLAYSVCVLLCVSHPQQFPCPTPCLLPMSLSLSLSLTPAPCHALACRTLSCVSCMLFPAPAPCLAGYLFLWLVPCVSLSCLFFLQLPPCNVLWLVFHLFLGLRPLAHSLAPAFSSSLPVMCSIMHWIAFSVSHLFFLQLSTIGALWLILSQAPTLSCTLAHAFWLACSCCCFSCSHPVTHSGLCPLASFSSCHCVSHPFPPPHSVVPSSPVPLPLVCPSLSPPPSFEVELMLISFCVVEYKSIHLKLNKITFFVVVQ